MGATSSASGQRVGEPSGQPTTGEMGAAQAAEASGGASTAWSARVHRRLITVHLRSCEGLDDEPDAIVILRVHSTAAARGVTWKAGGGTWRSGDAYRAS